jgi:hypothetical protein
MSADIQNRLRAEVDLIERFTQTYRRKFDVLIERLNRSAGPSDLHCVRLCVEAVNMLLSSQAQVARTIRAMADEGEGPEQAPQRRAA